MCFGATPINSFCHLRGTVNDEFDANKAIFVYFSILNPYLRPTPPHHLNPHHECHYRTKRTPKHGIKNQSGSY